MSNPASRAAWVVLVAGACAGCGDSDAVTPSPPAAVPDAASDPVENGPCDDEGTLVCGADEAGTAHDLILACSGGSYERAYACPGQQRCTTYPGRTSVLCASDTESVPYAKTGAPCANVDSAACSFDQSVVLACVEGLWVEAIHCPPSACALRAFPADSYVECANGGYSIGDRCDNWDDGMVACSTDLGQILGCSSGVTAVVEDCGAGQCTRVGSTALTCQ